MDMALSPQACPPGSVESSHAKEGALLYKAGTTYLGKEQWKSCYLILRYWLSPPGRQFLFSLQKSLQLLLLSKPHPDWYTISLVIKIVFLIRLL